MVHLEDVNMADLISDAIVREAAAAVTDALEPQVREALEPRYPKELMPTQAKVRQRSEKPRRGKGAKLDPVPRGARNRANASQSRAEVAIRHARKLARGNPQRALTQLEEIFEGRGTSVTAKTVLDAAEMYVQLLERIPTMRRPDYATTMLSRTLERISWTPEIADRCVRLAKHSRGIWRLDAIRISDALLAVTRSSIRLEPKRPSREEHRQLAIAKRAVADLYELRDDPGPQVRYLPPAGGHFLHVGNWLEATECFGRTGEIVTQEPDRLDPANREELLHRFIYAITQTVADPDISPQLSKQLGADRRRALRTAKSQFGADSVNEASARLQDEFGPLPRSGIVMAGR